MALSAEELARRKAIIETSKTFSEAAEKLGMKYNAVQAFAQRHGIKLSPASKKVVRPQITKGVPMSAALNERGQLICKRFFNALMMARQRGFKLSVIDAINCWHKMAREGRLND